MRTDKPLRPEVEVQGVGAVLGGLVTYPGRKFVEAGDGSESREFASLKRLKSKQCLLTYFFLYFFLYLLMIWSLSLAYSF